MARKKYDFLPDKTGSGLLGKLYITKLQRLKILRWTLLSVLLVVLSVLQDVVLCKLNVFGATTDLVPAGILLLTMLLDPEEGAVFSLVASTFFYFSGAAPGPYAIALLTGLGTVANIFRHGYLRVGFPTTFFCAAFSVMAYELLVYVTGSFLQLTLASRFVVFCVTGGLSVAVLPILYPAFLSIGKIGGETWKE